MRIECMRVLSAVVMAAVLGFTGCKSLTPEILVTKNLDAARAAIHSEIQDPARRTAMLAMVDEYSAEMKAIAQDARDVRKKIDAAECCYETTTGQLQVLYDDLGLQLKRVCDTGRKHSLALRKQCSEAEWKAIVAHQSEQIQFKLF